MLCTLFFRVLFDMRSVVDVKELHNGKDAEFVVKTRCASKLGSSEVFA